MAFERRHCYHPGDFFRFYFHKYRDESNKLFFFHFAYFCGKYGIFDVKAWHIEL